MIALMVFGFDNSLILWFSFGWLVWFDLLFLNFVGLLGLCVFALVTSSAGLDFTYSWIVGLVWVFGCGLICLITSMCCFSLILFAGDVVEFD